MSSRVFKQLLYMDLAVQGSVNMGTIKYENIIASVTLKGHVDLESIAEALPGSSFDPNVFPGLMYQQKSPKSVIFLFKSGKLLITGPDSYAHLEEALESFLGKVKRSGIVLQRASPIATKNIAATFDTGKPVDLKAAAKSLGGSATYDPSKFPGLICKVSGNITLLVFPTGMIVSTGTKTAQETKAAFETLLKKARL